MGKGKRVSGSSARYDPQKTKDSMDHHQNNSYVKAVGTLPVGSNLCALLIAVSTAVRSSHNDNVQSTTVEEQLKQRVVQVSEASSASLLLISHGVC